LVRRFVKRTLDAAFREGARLRELDGYSADHAYVFPGAKTDAPLVEIDHVWAAVRHAAAG